MIGCQCENCTSSDSRDRRTRHGALVRLPHGNLLIDTPPELRLQLLREGVSQVDAVWYTHLHADHTHGIDDVRIFSTKGRGPVTTYLPAEMEEQIKVRFPYIFDGSVRLPDGTTKPRMVLRPYEDQVAQELLGTRVTPFRVPHGPGHAYGFRVGGLGYVTDAKSLPDAARECLNGVTVLVLNALWWRRPHPTHFNVEEAISVAQEIGAQRTYLTHLTHFLGYKKLAAELPAGIEPAYDSLTVEVEAE